MLLETAHSPRALAVLSPEASSPPTLQGSQPPTSRFALSLNFSLNVALGGAERSVSSQHLNVPQRPPQSRCYVVWMSDPLQH